jgi:uncharacterized membrane protein
MLRINANAELNSWKFAAGIMNCVSPAIAIVASNHLGCRISAKLWRMVKTFATIVITLLLLSFYNVTNHVDLAGDLLLTTADRIAYTVCHRLPTHSFEIFGRSLPLCARCSGIYLGIVWGFVYLTVQNRWHHASYPRRNHTLFLIALIALMGFDGFNSLFHDIGIFELYPPQNWLRLVTGMGTGIAIALIIAPTFAQTAWRQPIWQPPVGARRDALVLTAGALAIILLLISGIATVIYLLALLSAFGVVLILTLLYTVLVLLFTQRDSVATAPRILVVPFSGGLILATIQIVVVMYLRYRLTGTWLGF